MKVSRIFFLSFVLSVLFVVLTVSANAALQVQEPVAGEFVVYDTDTNLMWVQSANLSGTGMNWASAMNWADTLIYGGYSDWRLPTLPAGFTNYTYDIDDDQLGDLGELFYNSLGNSFGTLTNSSPFADTPASGSFNFHWTDTEDPGGGTYMYYFGRGDLGVTSSGNPGGQAWAVRVVPEPISSILFITGGGVLFGRRFLKRKPA